MSFWTIVTVFRTILFDVCLCVCKLFVSLCFICWGRVDVYIFASSVTGTSACIAVGSLVLLSLLGGGMHKH